jgi:hypothetical protein
MKHWRTVLAGRLPAGLQVFIQWNWEAKSALPS